MSTVELTPRQIQALDEQGIVQGDDFILMRPAAFREWLGFHSDEELRNELQGAFDAADRGELVEWSVENFLARMHRDASERT